MKYMFHLRARPEDCPSPTVRHDQLIECLEALAGKTWAFDASRLSRFDPTDTLPLAQCTLTRGFRTKTKGTVHYFNREIATDHGRCDDILDLEFDPLKQDYAFVLETVFPRLVSSFGCYYGWIAEWEEWTDRVDRLGFCERRTTVRQLDIVNFFDQQLCRRAFDLTPKQITKRLDGKVASATSLENGVLIITTREIVDGDTAKQTGESLRQVLSGK